LKLGGKIMTRDHRLAALASAALLMTACASTDSGSQEQDATELGCWLGNVPLDECFPDRYASYEVRGRVQRAENGEHHAYPGVTVRWSNSLYESVILSDVSNDDGEVRYDMPGHRYGATSYTLEVFDEHEELRFLSKQVATGFKFFDVTFDEEGYVSVCEWTTDDGISADAFNEDVCKDFLYYPLPE
jgi:hypothetical protein